VRRGSHLAQGPRRVVAVRSAAGKHGTDDRAEKAREARLEVRAPACAQADHIRDTVGRASRSLDLLLLRLLPPSSGVRPTTSMLARRLARSSTRPSRRSARCRASDAPTIRTTCVGASVIGSKNDRRAAGPVTIRRRPGLPAHVPAAVRRPGGAVRRAASRSASPPPEAQRHPIACASRPPTADEAEPAHKRQ
jgi:hypothetical protein